MPDVKLKKFERKPKIKDDASRLPKELIRTATLKAKEKPSQTSDAATSVEGQESSTDYANRKVKVAEEWAAQKTKSTVIAAGRNLTLKSYKRIKERRQATVTVTKSMGAGSGQEAAETAREPSQAAGADSELKGVGKEREKAFHRQHDSTNRVKEKPESKEIIRTVSTREVKGAHRTVKTAPVSYEKIKSNQIAAWQGQVGFTLRAARSTASRVGGKTSMAAATGTTVKRASTTVKGIKAAIQGTAASVKALGALLAPAGGVLAVCIIIVGILAGVMFSGSSQSAEPLSQEVLNYTSVIQRYASQYRIPDFVSILQAIMMQESGGRGNDPMQSSECPYNTRFPNSPNAITDPEYSIQVGVQYYASCVAEAGCESPYDMDKLKLSLQGYNYGNGYITWATRKYGGYSEANALEFSQEQAASHGWARYGDPEYVPHVLRYFSGGNNHFAGLFGNEQIVTIAKEQIGNEGGEKFWSWYGYDHRVSWCACFVSWCANQCGLIESGCVTKFSFCPDGITWFQNQERWKERNYTPVPGTIIFFDWPDRNTGIRDGISDHVGIVEKCENGIVYTIEGNSSDSCRQRTYQVGDESIMGYGLLNN